MTEHPPIAWGQRMSRRRRRGLLTVSAPLLFALLCALAVRSLVVGVFIAATTSILVLVGLATIRSFFAGVWTHPVTMRLRQHPFRGWEEIVTQLAAAMERELFVIPGPTGSVIAGVPRLVVHLAPGDFRDCSAHWNINALAEHLTRVYASILKQAKASVPVGEKIEVTIVPDCTVPSGRYRIKTRPTPLDDGTVYPRTSKLDFAPVIEPADRNEDSAGADGSGPADSAGWADCGSRSAQPDRPSGRNTQESSTSAMDWETRRALAVQDRAAAAGTREAERGRTVHQVFYRPLKIRVALPADSEAKPRTFTAHSAVVEFGRSRSCDITLDFDTVSAFHGRFIWLSSQGGWNVEDLGSLNGLLVNGAQLLTRRAVQDGDIISVGRTPDAPQMIVKLPEQATGKG